MRGFFDKLVILRDKLIPLFGNKPGQYDVTQILINNFIDLGKKLPELFGIVDSVDRLWTTITKTGIYNEFNKPKTSIGTSTESNAASGAASASKSTIVAKIIDWIDKINTVVDTLNKTNIVGNVKTLVGKLEEIEFDKLGSLLTSTDTLFNILNESSLMNMFSSNGVAAENTSTIKQSNSKIEEKTKEIISYISAADQILKAVNESSLVESINTLAKHFGENDVASSIDKAVRPISAVLGIYSKLKQAFFFSRKENYKLVTLRSLDTKIPKTSQQIKKSVKASRQ